MRIAALLFVAMLGVAPVCSQAAPVREIGTIKVNVDSRMLSVRVSASTPELNALACKAFDVHGRYARTSASNAQFEIRFTKRAENTIQVDVTRGGGGAVLSEVVTGSSDRNALLRAADRAVEATNGLGLKGFFASKLSFVSEATGHREVCKGDLFFGEVFRLTNDKSHALSPRWSPDGERIIYTSYYKTHFPDIFQISTKTYQRTTFASFKGTNSGARFSPTGRQVAMILSGEGNPELYVVSASGGKPLRLTRTKDSVEASPCFSPDGGRIVYTSDMAGGPQLYIIPAGGGTPSRINTGISRYCAEPDWSVTKPNLIAFTALTRGYQVAVHDLSTGKASVVSNASFDAVEPSWLADGRHVVYTARDKRSSVICILDTVTGRSTPVSASNLGQVCQASVLAQ